MKIVIGLAPFSTNLTCLAHLVNRERNGRASDSESRGHGFDPNRRHRVVSLSKTH